MDTTTVAATLVIRLTGLLLFVPDQGTDGRPTHVLMPSSGNLSAHVAQVGYRTQNSSGCDYYRNQICYFNVTGYYLEMPGSATGSGPGTLPAGALNLTDLSGHRVPRRFLGTTPPTDTVRSRITLPAGRVTGRCQLAEFGIGGSPVEVDQVVEWTVSDAVLPNGRLVLQRVPFNGGSPQTIVNVSVSANQRFELFVRQVPTTQQHHPGPGPGPVLGDLGDHMHAFYNLLGVPSDSSKRPIPRVTGTLGFPRACPWVPSTALHGKALAEIFPSPTTVNCMVASALPET